MTVEGVEGQKTIRREMVDEIERDLIGPYEANEILTEPPLLSYMAGILFPNIKEGGPASSDTTPVESVEVIGGEPQSVTDPGVSLTNMHYPSSAGISFAVAEGVDRITVEVTAARYECEAVEPDHDAGGDPQERWRRVPIESRPRNIDLTDAGEPVPLDGTDGLILRTLVRAPTDGVRSVTIAIVNQRSAEKAHLKDADTYFQVRMSVSGTSDFSHPFVARPQRLDIEDEDLRSNRLLYRDVREYAVGHGCSAEWGDPDESGNVSWLGGTFLPRSRVGMLESNPEIEDVKLASLVDGVASADVVATLRAFVSGYESWISDTERESLDLDEDMVQVADGHIRDCRLALHRMGLGIDAIERDPQVQEAFGLANRAIRDQMIQARKASGDESESEPGWRPFQLAFILLTAPTVVDPKDDFRELVDLLWFPTGGGKTEAYLGLFAFTVFHRRLSRNGVGGVTALMRYTLRLLTAQQFERAARVVCACELLRRGDTRRLGEEEISIGLLVGKSTTPNTVEAARGALRKHRHRNPVTEGDPCQLEACPWCANHLSPSLNYTTPESPPRLQIECRNQDCPFQQGIPVYLVDEDLFRIRPTLVVGTIDKFASLAWRPEMGNLFNLDRDELPPPDLIIQDELHLISGPLGTVSGLYETAVDILCRESGDPPKIVASTATIRRAREQSKGLFGRETFQFPPPGIEPDDNWFATRSESLDREYVGLMAPGFTQASLLIRCYAALLQKTMDFPKDSMLDPYWSLVGFFNSLRVLGAARMQVQDDVKDRIELLAARRGVEPRLIGDDLVELTSRIDSTSIPRLLKEMQVGLTDATDDGGSRDVNRPFDVALATNMISVGVDIDRLGLMVVMGQPQAAAEYIQATSRVGRKHPGLVIDVLNAAKSRDRSHFEGFNGFHAALYRSVEATSVTPFSARARDRALHAVLVILVRLLVPELRDNSAAGNIADHEEIVDSLVEKIVERAEVAGEARGATERDLVKFVAEWKRLAATSPDLVYGHTKKEDENRMPLLVSAEPDSEPAHGYATMWSMRSVDAESNLFMGA